MLFDKDRHETLTKSLWDHTIVQTEILSIIDDIQRSLLTNACWPTHPRDANNDSNVEPKWRAYDGAAGTIHALQILSGYGYKVNDLTGLIEVVYQSFLNAPDCSVEPGLQIGELGILMPAILANPDHEELSRLVMRCMEDTIELPMYEITSGQSGMMHAALALYRKTGKNHWKDLYIKGANSLIDNWKQDKDTEQWLWQSQVFGSKHYYYGACHGITGNANILLQGVDLLPEGYTEMIVERTVDTLVISVKRKDNLANWARYAKPDNDKLLVQWCHGAAGIVTAMSRTPSINSHKSKELDELLYETGELVWQAGPLTKGSGICHGTSGNGYAFLYLYLKTRNLLWLDRARKFAIHAIEQSQKSRIHFGQARFTLWTGDAGLAIYLYHCMNPDKAAIPGLDLF